MFSPCITAAKVLWLYSNGALTIADIPADYELNDKQHISACVVSGKPYIDTGSLKQFLSSLQYPLYFLDSRR